MELITPDVGTMFWMLLVFLTVMFVLTKFAWKPTLKAIQNRSKTIEDALKSAERAKEEMEKLQANNEKILAEARVERDLLLKDARSMKDKIINDAKEIAVTEAKGILESAKISINNEKAAAIAEIKNQVATLSVQIAEKILKQKLEEDQKQKDLINSLMKDMKLN
jgi:F-type H+-transporting ATPase subunit b